eukprot:14825554-Alexandrium_andersonii.AAC.1
MPNLSTERADGCAGGALRTGPGGRSPPGRPMITITIAIMPTWSRRWQIFRPLKDEYGLFVGFGPLP